MKSMLIALVAMTTVTVAKADSTTSIAWFAEAGFEPTIVAVQPIGSLTGVLGSRGSVSIGSFAGLRFDRPIVGLSATMRYQFADNGKLVIGPAVRLADSHVRGVGAVIGFELRF